MLTILINNRLETGDIMETKFQGRKELIITYLAMFMIYFEGF